MTNAQDKVNNLEFRQIPSSSNNRYHISPNGALEFMNCCRVHKRSGLLSA